MHYKMQELLLKGEIVIATSKNVEELIAFVDQNSLMANNLSCGNSEAKKEWADLVKRIRFLVKAHNRLSEEQLEDIIRFDKETRGK